MLKPVNGGKDDSIIDYIFWEETSFLDHSIFWALHKGGCCGTGVVICGGAVSYPFGSSTVFCKDGSCQWGVLFFFPQRLLCHPLQPLVVVVLFSKKDH